MVYSSDMYGENLNRTMINYRDFYRDLIYKTLDLIKSFVGIDKEWTSIKANQCDLFECIKRFDEGYKTICVVDNNDNFLSLVCESIFREDLPNINFRKWANLYINYENKTTEALKSDLSKMYMGFNRMDIPILNDKKIIAMGHRNAFTQKEFVSAFKLKLNWGYIPQSVIVDLFKKSKILLSSYAGVLSNFYDLFHTFLDITILDQISINDYFDSKFDIIIFNSDIWPKLKSTKKLGIRDLYRHLLTNYIHEWLGENNIRYIEYQSLSDITNLQNRWSKQLLYTFSTGHGCIRKNEYMVLPDLSSDECNIVNNKRITTNSPKEYDNSIHFFGPCTAVGSFVKNDSDTIESNLQRAINHKYKD